jgi:hypothetical protein
MTRHLTRRAGLLLAAGGLMASCAAAAARFLAGTGNRPARIRATGSFTRWRQTRSSPGFPPARFAPAGRRIPRNTGAAAGSRGARDGTGQLSS